MCGVPARKSLEVCTAEKTKSKLRGETERKNCMYPKAREQSIDEKARSKRRVEDERWGIAYEWVIIRTGSRKKSKRNNVRFAL